MQRQRKVEDIREKGRSSDDDQSRTDQKEQRPRKVKPIEGFTDNNI